MGFDQENFALRAVEHIDLGDMLVSVFFGPSVVTSPSAERWIQHVLTSSRREKGIPAAPASGPRAIQR